MRPVVDRLAGSGFLREKNRRRILGFPHVVDVARELSTLASDHLGGGELSKLAIDVERGRTIDVVKEALLVVERDLALDLRPGDASGEEGQERPVFRIDRRGSWRSRGRCGRGRRRSRRAPPFPNDPSQEREGHRDEDREHKVFQSAHLVGESTTARRRGDRCVNGLNPHNGASRGVLPWACIFSKFSRKRSPMSHSLRFFLPLGLLVAAAMSPCGCSSSSSTTDGGGASSGSSGGSSGTASVLPLAPSPLGGWTYNPTPTGYPKAAYNFTDATADVDGTADAFFPDGGPAAVAMLHAYYLNSGEDGGNDAGTPTVEYLLWEMASASDAAARFTNLPIIDTLYANMTVTPSPVVGNQALITPSTVSFIHLMIQKDAYILFLRFGQGETQDDALAFATAATALLP